MKDIKKSQLLIVLGGILIAVLILILPCFVEIGKRWSILLFIFAILILCYSLLYFIDLLPRRHEKYYENLELTSLE
jgi:hypothetical protein